MSLKDFNEFVAARGYREEDGSIYFGERLRAAEAFADECRDNGFKVVVLQIGDGHGDIWGWVVQLIEED